MEFAHVTLTVNNLEESLNFYHKIVGLPILNRFKGGNGQEFVFLGGEGETLVELIYDNNIKDLNMGKDISIGFRVKSLDETMEMIREEEIDIHSGPFQPNEVTKFFFVLDPNGLKVQFIEH